MPTLYDLGYIFGLFLAESAEYIYNLVAGI